MSSSPPAHPDAGDPASPQDAGDPPAPPVFFPDEDRSLYHQPVVVGFLEYEGPTPRHPRPFHHAEPPHRSASAARALAEAADFDCSFLPSPGSWRVHDATGGLLLLSSDPSDDTGDLDDELVVCDPLYCRYVRIPSIPDDLTAAIDDTPGVRFDFLAPTIEEERSSFRVISMIYENEKMKVTAFVFSSATNQWRRVTFDGWKMKRGYIPFVPTSCCNHPHRSLYRESRLFNEVLMLDTHRMEFSVVRTPLADSFQQHAIVEAGEGRKPSVMA